MDANIIYRLMGINNEARRKATKDFIEKCKDADIKVLYTNITYQELLDTFDYHVDKLKNILQVIKASPQSIQRLYQDRNDSAFYTLYYNWAIKNNSYEKWSEFKNYLRDELRKTVGGFTKKTIPNFKVFKPNEFDMLSDNLEQYKISRRSNTYRANVEYDIQNVLHILKERNAQCKNVWEVNDFIISADQVLTKWSEDTYPGEAPLVVVPSIWYSLLLKLTGRSEDDYKAYVEFMKLRYMQVSDASTEEIIFTIANLTQDGQIQDRIIDIITDESKRIYAAESSIQTQDIKLLVNNVYDEVLEQIRTEEHGVGFNEGIASGYHQGIEEAKKVQFDKGKRVGELENERKEITTRIKTCAKKQRIRNRAIIGIGSIIILVFIYVICKWIWTDLPAGKTEQFGLIFTLITVVGGGTIWVKIKYLLCTDLDELEKRISKKYQSQITDIDNKLNEIN